MDGAGGSGEGRRKGERARKKLSEKSIAVGSRRPPRVALADVLDARCCGRIGEIEASVVVVVVVVVVVAAWRCVCVLV
jgi:hypothetical protein